jgi:murein DD-endopeptidase MepM/ murein hydrolase activator NlpD
MKPFKDKTVTHTGVDIVAEKGISVLATTSGKAL